MINLEATTMFLGLVIGPLVLGVIIGFILFSNTGMIDPCLIIKQLENKLMVSEEVSEQHAKDAMHLYSQLKMIEYALFSAEEEIKRLKTVANN